MTADGNGARAQEAPVVGTVLLVDDDPDMLQLTAAWLRGAGFAIQTAASGPDALSRIEISRPDLVVTDLFMDGMDGLDLLKEIHAGNPLLPVIMLSGQAQIPDAVRATHLGTAAFLTKPIAKERLIAEVSAQMRAVLERKRRHGRFGANIVYRSAIMQELLEQAEMVAPTDVTVFISGETGTGKEVLARAIHDASPRAAQAFVGVNCGAIPENLLESELFGHEKGAFTGANTRHEGLFMAANGGTMFLDEIGDMPLGLQVKLLRVLQDLQVRPVGATRSVAVDARIISATHNRLDELVRNGEFREDLYYRLNVVPLHMPSLAERREDIPLLLDHFLGVHATRHQQRKKHFDAEALDYLTAAAWPGNVRQLVNAVELCATLTKGDQIGLAMAQRALREKPGRIQTLKEARDAFERRYLISVMRVANGNVATAARVAGRNRTEFYKLLGFHGIDAASFRGGSAAQDESDQ
ncbi:MAG TPA: sigma 54-interacting transcriptional regulator [Gammaproteobacteria bacterium]|nr:sigma 54-interacting transcriptional regulator [Gammaproteobacteria bacterium]